MTRTIQNRLEDGIRAHGGEVVERKIKRGRLHLKMSIGDLLAHAVTGDRSDYFLFLGPSGSLRGGRNISNAYPVNATKALLLREQP